MRAILHRLAAVLILIAVLAGFGTAVAMPLLALKRAHEETVADLKARITRLQAVNARRSALESRLTAMEASDRTSERLLSEDSAPLAAAALQSRVKALAERSGSALTSSQVQAATQDALFERVSLRLQMDGDIGALHRFMTLLQSETPSIFVNSLQISAASRGRNAANDIYSPVPLQWAVEVYAYRRGDGR